ncbi:MAG TPA: SIMPL domain-containing protein [Acidimicrobiales bacterium]|nr:SIMPL domain-containing protein [Acidimicrobiales bacterium]
MVASTVVAAASATAAATATVAGSAVHGAAACGPTAAKLTVRGTGEATGTPDLLILTLSVSTSAPTANGALDQNNQAASAVTAALAAGGVKGKDVQTTGLSIQPQFDKTGSVTGYAVTNSVVADIHQLSSAGSIIDAAAGAAGDAVRIGGVTFSIEDPRPLEDRARRDAVRQAVSHATAMAAAAGQRLAGVCSIRDDSAAPVPVSATFGSVASAAPSAVPLERGSQQASAEVTVVYALAAGRAGKGGR